MRCALRCRVYEKLLGFTNHRADHSADFGTVGHHLFVLIFLYVFTVFREVKRCLCFVVLSIAVRQFADEVRFMPSLRPGFLEVLAH